MDTHSPLESILFFLLAAAIAVPLFRRFGLGAILGYLCAGVVIGPQCLSLIADPKNVLHFSEIGVVLLLFMIGLELNPAKLWGMRSDIAVLGGGQVLLSSALVIALVYVFFDQTLSSATVVGIALALSSTAFAMQLMAEKGILGGQNGRRGFSILLMQDLAVIPILFIVQSFASTASAESSSPWWPGPLAIVGMLLFGRFLINPLLKLIANFGGRESMTATALLIVVGSAYVMESAHLSMGLGAFMAGIMLANSSFRHQLETDIEPFKGLTLGLFFIAIGMTLDLQQLIDRPLFLLACAFGLMMIKALLIMLLLKLSEVKFRQGILIGSMLSQGGEFGFVIMAQAQSQQILAADTASMVTLIIGLSMALTVPFVLIIERSFKSKQQQEKISTIDMKHDEPEVLILGFGRFGQVTGRILAANGIPFTALDKDAEHIEFVKQFGNKIYYGNANRMDLLEKAGISYARTVIVAIDDASESENIVRHARNIYPDLTIIARARNRVNYLKLKNAGADFVIREVFSSSLNAATETLVSLGYSTGQALKATEIFKTHDEQLLESALEHHDDLGKIIEIGLQGRKELEQLFKQDFSSGGTADQQYAFNKASQKNKIGE